MSSIICPHCHNPIDDDDALLCLYCGESLERRIGVLAHLRYPKPLIVLALVVISLLSAFILIMVF